MIDLQNQREDDDEAISLFSISLSDFWRDIRLLPFTPKSETQTLLTAETTMRFDGKLFFR